MHGSLSPDLSSMEQIRRVMRPTDVPDSGLLCDLLWSDPEKGITGWGDNDRGVSLTFGPDIAMHAPPAKARSGFDMPHTSSCGRWVRILRQASARHPLLSPGPRLLLLTSSLCHPPLPLL